jgi:hypothetical protein
MENLAGYKIDGRSFPKFTWNADLIAFDGPLLSLFRREDGIDSLFVWLDCNSKSHRWAVIDISRDCLSDYLTQRMTLLAVFQKSSSVIVFDQYQGGRYNFIETVWTKLPKIYLPTDDSFLTDDIATEDARKLAIDATKIYSIKLDGELFIDDLAAIPRLYQQLYSFHYGLEHLSREAVRNTISSLASKWNGGFSAVNLFDGLRNVTPSIHRAKIRNLHYASPGHIQLDLLPKMAEKIRMAADSIGSAQALPQAEELYKQIYKYFRENNISGFEDERSSKENNLTIRQITELKTFVDSFINLLEWYDYKDQFTSLDMGPLPQLRTLLAYYRRLRRLLSYQHAGLIKLT